jgi:hypothetical protein
VINIAGRIEELAQKSLAEKEEQQKFYSELVAYTEMKGYKEGFAAVKFKEKYGDYPKGLHKVPLPVSPKTLSWLKHRAIAYAKSKNSKLGRI